MPGRQWLFCFFILVMTICIVLVNFEQSLISFDWLVASFVADNGTESIIEPIYHVSNNRTGSIIESINQVIIRELFTFTCKVPRMRTLSSGQKHV